jgi:hypothetical protein
MARFNPAVLVFAVLCGITLPALLKHSPSRPGFVFVLTILFFVVVLAYADWIGWRVRKVVPRPANWTPQQRHLALRRLESELRSLRVMRRRPLYVLLFLLFGVAITGSAVFVLPCFPGSPNEHAMVQAWGTLFGAAYLFGMALFAKMWLTGGWERYLNFYIHKAETLQGALLVPPSRDDSKRPIDTATGE